MRKTITVFIKKTNRCQLHFFFLLEYHLLTPFDPLFSLHFLASKHNDRQVCPNHISLTHYSREMFKKCRRYSEISESKLQKRIYKFAHRSKKEERERFRNACSFYFRLYMNQDGTIDLDKVHKALVKLGFTVKKNIIKSHYNNFHNPENDCQYEFTLSTLYIIGIN